MRRFAHAWCVRNVLPLMTCAAVAAVLTVTAAARGAAVTVTPIGAPAWDVVDFNLFSADVGTGASGFAEFFTLTGSQILPEPNHQEYPDVGAGPGAPHAPPYDQELSQGIAALGLEDRSTFSAADFTNGQGILLAFMVVGNGDEVGSSPDFTSGPILPNALFPLHFEIANTKGGVNFSEAGALDVPSATTLDPAFADLEGTSHFPFFVFDSAEFAIDPSAPLAGSYQFEVRVTDTAGNGYSIAAPYSITGGDGGNGGGGGTPIPLPAAVWPGLALLLATKPATRILCRRP